MTAQLGYQQRYTLTLGPATVEDWLAADGPVDGSRLELILGYFAMSPPPTSGHQRVSYRLARAVEVWSPGNSKGERETTMAPPATPVSFRGHQLAEAKYVQVVHAEAGETITAPGPIPIKLDTALPR